MTRTLDKPRRWILAAGVLAPFPILLGVGSARAASYGGSTFSGSNEGWTTTSTACTLPEPLCASRGEYDGAVGNPVGALAAKGSITLGAVGLVNAEATFESPGFTVGDGGQGAVNLQRAFEPGGLVEAAAQLTYTATLLDKTTGQQQKAISETVSGASSFTGKSGGVSLVAGHTYAVVVESKIGASVVGLSFGTSTAGFDNVSVTGPGGGGGGNGNGNGAPGDNGGNGAGGGNGLNGLTDANLETLIRGSLSGNAAVKGGKVLIKAKCPSKVGAACRVRLQGFLKKGKPATAPRTVKIAKGKSKLVAITVKPKLKGTVSKRRKLLFKETVQAARARATVYKTLKLIRR